MCICFCWSGIFPLLVKMCLCFSLFFTYPVMMFPVVQIIEKRWPAMSSSYIAGVSPSCCITQYVVCYLFQGGIVFNACARCVCYYSRSSFAFRALKAEVVKNFLRFLQSIFVVDQVRSEGSAVKPLFRTVDCHCMQLLWSLRGQRRLALTPKACHKYF